MQKTFAQFLAEVAVPTEADSTRQLHGVPEPGHSHIPDGHIRLFHQTSLEHLASIKKHGIQMSHAKGIEGPRSVYADEKGFYGQPGQVPSAEFHIPRHEWHGNGQIPRSVHPHEIVATHEPWHDKARYLIRNPVVHANLMKGKFDDLTGHYKTAVDYVKKHHPTLD